MLKNEKSLIIRLKTNKNYLNHKYLLLNNIPMTSKKYHGPVTNMKIVVSSTTPKLIDNLSDCQCHHYHYTKFVFVDQSAVM